MNLDRIQADQIRNSPAINSWVSVKMLEAGERMGLRLAWIKTQKELAQVGQSGLFDLYCSVFAEPPYLEKFTSQDVKDYFEDILQKQGIVFTAQLLRAGRPDVPVAFVASIPLDQKQEVAQVIPSYLDVDVSRTAYFAEDAVLLECRRQGISREMKRLLLGTNRRAGYEKIVLRTSVNSFNQAAAVKQLGAEPIEGAFQDVQTPRLDGSISPDRRVFYTFDLTSPTLGERKGP